MSSKSSDLDATDNIGITLMTLRKPTELKKLIDTIPKPVRAIPKNGLPLWYRLGLECKLPVPKIPEGKIVFSRGKIGEDVRRIGLGGGPCPNFDLTDPYCYNVSYDYVAVHDPHLTHHFSQKPIRQRMIVLGYCTPDGRAKCSLKEFNQYRKYLYNQFMDRIHMEMKHLDERARNDLVLKRVDDDVVRREQVFTKTERARKHLEMVEQENADELAEKRRLAKEREKKIKARRKYLAEFNEKQRKERALRSREKENRIKQRVQAAAELELRRKVKMIRQWRDSERKRQNRLKQERETKQRMLEEQVMLEEQANNKWKARVDTQNHKIQEEALLLKIYSEDMKSAAMRRIRRAEVYAYNTDLELQRIKMANWKAQHGGTTKAAYLVKKMGMEFVKSKRGSKCMSVQMAQRLADEAMAEAVSTQGDALMTLAQARHRMDIASILPSPPVKLLDQMVEMAIIEFTRKCLNRSLQDIENIVRNKSSIEFFQRRADSLTKGKKVSRRSMQVVKSVPQPPVNEFNSYISFGEVTLIPPHHSIDGDIRSIKERTPTPVPSKSTLVEVTFSDRVEDLPDPVALANHLPERKKLIETIHTAEKLLMRLVSGRVRNGMDAVTQEVTLPHMRHSIDWREAVVGMATAIVEGRMHTECPELRQASDLLAYRVLHSLQLEARRQKEKQRSRLPSFDEPKDFYVPS